MVLYICFCHHKPSKYVKRILPNDLILTIKQLGYKDFLTYVQLSYYNQRRINEVKRLTDDINKVSKDVCETTCIHEDVVKRVQPLLEMNDAELLFKALSDSTRLKITYALTLEKELCVCDVANIIGSTTSTASHHLRHLRNMGLAKYRKEGKLVYYSVVDEHVRQLVNLAIDHSKRRLE